MQIRAYVEPQDQLEEEQVVVFEWDGFRPEREKDAIRRKAVALAFKQAKLKSSPPSQTKTDRTRLIIG